MRLRGSVDGRQLLVRDSTCWVGEGLIHPHPVRCLSRPVVGRCTDDVAIVVIGIALQLHAALAAAVGATRKIGVVWRLAVDRLRNCFRSDGLEVFAAIAIVGDTFRMIDHPIRLPRTVTCVGPCSRVAALQV
ncbi:hypothetical protein D3C86_1735670 [compost metagenome]